MNTCRAGAELTTRSKRGSTGAPGTLGISARSGGSSASRTASGCLAFRWVALSISESTPWSTLNGAHEPNNAATIATRLVRFTIHLLLLAGSFTLRGRPVLLALDRRIKLDGFSRLGPLQDDFLVADPHQSRVAVAPAQTDRPAVDRRLAAVSGDDHDLRGRRTDRRLKSTRGAAENFPGRPGRIAQSLREAE